MGLTVKIDSARAVPSRIRSGGKTTVSIDAFGQAGPTRALCEYVIGDLDPFVFGNNEKRALSPLLFVSSFGTSLSSPLTVRATGTERGQVTITILVSERNVDGDPIGPDTESGVVVSVS